MVVNVHVLLLSNATPTHAIQRGLQICRFAKKDNGNGWQKLVPAPPHLHVRVVVHGVAALHFPKEQLVPHAALHNADNATRVARTVRAKQVVARLLYGFFYRPHVSGKNEELKRKRALFGVLVKASCPLMLAPLFRGFAHLGHVRGVRAKNVLHQPRLFEFGNGGALACANGAREGDEDDVFEEGEHLRFAKRNAKKKNKRDPLPRPAFGGPRKKKLFPVKRGFLLFSFSRSEKEKSKMSVSNFLQSEVMARSKNLSVLNKQLEEKNARLREQLKETKRDAQKERDEYERELGDAQLKLAAAMTTNSELRVVIAKQQHVITEEREKRCELVEKMNDKLLELNFVHAMRQEVELRHEALVQLHDQVMRALERAKDENVALRECNRRLVGELYEINKRLNE